MDVERPEPHPLLSLLAACFWVICTSFPAGKDPLTRTTTFYSMATIVGKNAHCICYHIGPKIHLLCAILFTDFYGTFPTQIMEGPMVLKTVIAQFLFIGWDLCFIFHDICICY